MRALRHPAAPGGIHRQTSPLVLTGLPHPSLAHRIPRP
jgi:hypothetical protein